MPEMIKLDVDKLVDEIKWVDTPNGYCRHPHIHGETGLMSVIVYEYRPGFFTLCIAARGQGFDNSFYAESVDSFEHGIAAAREFMKRVLRDFISSEYIDEQD